MEIDVNAKNVKGKMTVRRSKYIADKSIALGLFAGGQQMATATVCLIASSPPEGHVWIKDWAENEGLKDALIEANVIGPEVAQVKTGHVTATLHLLTADLPDESGI